MNNVNNGINANTNTTNVSTPVYKAIKEYSRRRIYAKIATCNSMEYQCVNTSYIPNSKA
jgi:hypothetical protein